MKVKDFVKVSYMEMIFRNVKTDNIIYHFTWNDDIGEDDFIDEYGHCKIEKIKGHCDGVVNVFIESEV